MRIIHLVRKPLEKSSVAANCLEHGTGALNIDAGRIAAPGETIRVNSRSDEAGKSRGIYGDSKGHGTFQTEGQKLGRWPPNVILEHLGGCSPESCDPGCPVVDLEEQSLVGGMHSAGVARKKRVKGGGSLFFGEHDERDMPRFGDKGGASRFYKQVGGSE